MYEIPFLEYLVPLSILNVCTTLRYCSVVMFYYLVVQVHLITARITKLVLVAAEVLADSWD